MENKYKKFAWIGMILMLLNGLAVWDFGLKIANSYGSEVVYSLVELGDSATLVYVVAFANVLGLIGALVLVLSSKEPNVLWYSTMAIAGGVGLVAVAYLMISMEELVDSIMGLEGLMNLLSIEFTVTESVWLHMGLSILILGCGIAPFAAPYLQRMGQSK